MQHPETALGSSQIKILKTLSAAKDSYIALETDRAMEKLWKKGFVRWQAVGKAKEWQITKQGCEALERRLG